jgi:hypothetical protein
VVTIPMWQAGSRKSQTGDACLFRNLHLAGHFACHGSRPVLLFRKAVPKSRRE